MDPADAEPLALRPQPVGEEERVRLAAAHDDEAVQLQAFHVLLDDRLVGRRLGERRVQVPVEVVERLEHEQAALAAGVGRLQDGREADGLGRRHRLAPHAHGRVAGLRHAALGEPAPHRDLVRHQVRRLPSRSPGRPSSSATAATTGTARSAETVSTPSIRALRRDRP